MSLEAAIIQLAEAIERHGDAIRYAAGIQGTSAAIGALTAAAKSDEPAAAPAPRRGRPPKAKPEVEAPEAPEAPVTTEVKGEEPAPAVAPAATDVDQTTVRKVLVELVKKHGKDTVGNLCRKHGAPNLTALDPSVYPAIVAEAQILLAKDAE